MSCLLSVAQMNVGSVHVVYLQQFIMEVVDYFNEVGLLSYILD